MASRESLFIGIDVSKQTLDVAFGADPHAPRETIPYTDDGGACLLSDRHARRSPHWERAHDCACPRRFNLYENRYKINHGSARVRRMTADVNQKIRADPCSISNPCRSVFYFQQRCGDAAPLRPYYSTVYSPSTTPSSLPFFAPAPSPPALV